MDEDQENYPDTLTKDRLDLAWKCILEQYFEKVKESSIEEGPGMGIFKFLHGPKNDGTNCQYLYTERDGPMWNGLMNFSPDGEKVQKFYDPVCMVVISVNIPDGGYGGDTIGNIKLFHRDSKEEISFLSLSNSSSTDKTNITEGNSGLRRRNVSSEK